MNAMNEEKTPDIRQILKQYWGYDDFRPLQSEIIMSVLCGHDTLGLLPTGGGKSITFQVPALVLGGLTLVVTPLIALMKDQCDHLVTRGIKAAAVFMGMTHKEVLSTYERVISDDYRFLYISPERLETQLFQAKLQYMDVRLLVIDEAHCISQWGYDFRPPYLKIANLRQLLRDIRERNHNPWQSPIPSFLNPHSSFLIPPCLALTATATPEVVNDIQDKLHFRPGAQVFQASFVRPNLTYSVVRTEDKIGEMIRLLRRQAISNKDLGIKNEELPPDTKIIPNSSLLNSSFTIAPAIVYVRSRKKTAEIAEALTRQGIPADYYHAGLRPEVKQQKQDAWMTANPPVIVATNAFGMGIDKPNVRTVIHLDLPPSIEEYYQEAGRAGRDGQPAQAWLLYDDNDKTRLLLHLQDEYPEREHIRHVYGRLASFYQIAIAAGYMNLFEFDIMRFCSAYHLAMTPVHYALRLLDQAGYISYIEDPDRHSRLMITCSRESLYHLNQFDPESQRILHALLRLYTGLFADFVRISEDDIVLRTGLDRQTLYDRLLLLSRFHVLHYIPARQKPAIVYLTPRLEDEELRIPHTIYEERQERQERRIRAMISYIDTDDECRLVQLLRYFGEDSDQRCGRCDTCLSHDLQGCIHEQRASLRTLILSHLRATGPMAVTSLQAHYRGQAPEDLFADLISDMVSQGDLFLTDGVLTIPHNSE